MSKLNIVQKTIRDLFSDKKADFLIPDYQRPYAWGDKECKTLWDDIFAFAFPDNDFEKINIVSVPLTQQKPRNATYRGPFQQNGMPGVQQEEVEQIKR